MKIEFGCGETPTKVDFKTCDIRNLPGVDFVCSAWDIDNFVHDESVDEIFSRHFFEHLTFQQGELVLEKWNKILKSDGICEIIVPNMTFHINQWNSRKNIKEISHARAGFWGWQRGDFLDTWDIHKSGYDSYFLTQLLNLKKFREIKVLTDETDKHLHVVCVK